MIQLRGEKEEDEENVPNHTFAVLMHSILERSAEEEDDVEKKVLKREEFHTWEMEASLPLSLWADWDLLCLRATETMIFYGISLHAISKTRFLVSFFRFRGHRLKQIFPPTKCRERNQFSVFGAWNMIAVSHILNGIFGKSGGELFETYAGRWEIGRWFVSILKRKKKLRTPQQSGSERN